jgi:DNA-binding CsgD family transcriptional regulator
MRLFPASVRTHQGHKTPLRSTGFKEIDEGEIQILFERQSHPGIIILNRKGKVLYQNEEAQVITEALAGRDQDSSRVSRRSLPQIVFEIYTEFKQRKALNRGPMERSSRFGTREYHRDDAVYLFRPLLLQSQRDESDSKQLLILIERIPRNLELSPHEKPVKLTPREKSVVKLLIEGMTNKEVARSMHIVEYTVKDHIKRIMKKYNVTTRAGIVAKSLSERRGRTVVRTPDRRGA